MELDIEEIIKGIGGILKESLGEDLPRIKQYAEKIVQSEKDTLEALAKLRLSNKITSEELKMELERRKLIVETEVLTGIVMSKAAAQKAANAIIDFLFKALETAVKTAL